MGNKISSYSDFAQANGWDFGAIEATARDGVEASDVERLAECDGLSADGLLAWCRERVAQARAAAVA